MHTIIISRSKQLTPMKKQSYYLPTLNSLYMRNKSYLKHVGKIRENTNQQQNYLFQRSPKSIHQNKHLQTTNKTIDVDVDSGKKDGSISIKLTIDDSNRYRHISPFAKRKLSLRDQENTRLMRALNTSVATVSYANQNHRRHSNLKERISKYIKDKNNKIKYKYKHSLALLEKQKKQKQAKNHYRSMELEKLAADKIILIRKDTFKAEPLRNNQYNQSDVYCLFLNEYQRNIEQVSQHQKDQNPEDQQKNSEMKQLHQTYRRLSSKVLVEELINQINRSKQKTFTRKGTQQNIEINILKLNYMRNAKKNRQQSKLQAVKTHLNALLSHQREKLIQNLKRKQLRIKDMQIVQIDPIRHKTVQNSKPSQEKLGKKAQ